MQPEHQDSYFVEIMEALNSTLPHVEHPKIQMSLTDSLFQRRGCVSNIQSLLRGILVSWLIISSRFILSP